MLPLTDWVRGTERLVEPREYFLSWGVEQNKPILKVTSPNGHREFRVNMKSEIRNLEVHFTNLGLLQDIYVLSIITRPQNSEHRHSSYNFMCAVYDIIPLLNPFSQVRIFFYSPTPGA